MKQLITVAMLVLLSTILHAQTSWSPVGAKWYYSANAAGTVPPGSEYYLYECTKDTTYEGAGCKKIEITYYKYNGDTAYLAPVFSYQSNDTVYYYNSIYSKFFPLYIFNVSVGDTLKFHSPDTLVYPTDTLFRVVVDSVSIFTVNAVPLKRIWTSPLDNFSFWGSYIEKIGSDLLMLHQPAAIYPEWDGPIRCYADDSISYNFSSKPCDYKLTSGTDELTIDMEYIIYPNPASEVLYIKGQTSKIGFYRIVNSMGQLMIQGQLQKAQTMILLNDLSDGIYTVQIFKGDSFQSKIIVLRK